MSTGVVDKILAAQAAHKVLYDAACAAAQVAAEQAEATLPPADQRGFDCGFAWVTVRPARGPFIAWCVGNKLGRNGGYEANGGYGFWGSSLHNVATQSISVHEAAARAFAYTLRSAGINVSVNSRLN